MQLIDINGLLYVIQKIKGWLGGKVDKVEGKGLSTNDLTNELIDKINNAGDSSFSGNFNDLDGIPTLDGTQLKGTLTKNGLNIASKTDIPTNNNQLTNGAGYQTATQVNTAVSNHNSSETAHGDIRNAIADARAIAEGRDRAIVFDTKAQLDQWLAGSYNHSSGRKKTDLKIGDNLYIKATDTPDYWWDGGAVQLLETEKVDLTEYLKNTDITIITNAEIDAILAM